MEPERTWDHVPVLETATCIALHLLTMPDDIRAKCESEREKGENSANSQHSFITRQDR